MLALADDAALARLVIAATQIPRRARSSWLRDLARTIESPDADRTRQARRRAKRSKGLRLHRLWIDDRVMEGDRGRDRPAVRPERAADCPL
jgi:hypothetical protein